MDKQLIDTIEQALKTVRHFAAFGFWPASSLEAQLEWCLNRAKGETVHPPDSPLHMSTLVAHEFADYGIYSFLAHQLKTIEIHMERLESEQMEYFALSA